ADLREAGLASEPVDVLAGGDEQLARALGAEREQLAGARRGGLDELLELPVELAEFVFEVADPAAEAAQRELGRFRWLVEAVAVGAQLQAEPCPRLQRARLP